MIGVGDGQALGGVQGISPVAPDVQTTLALIDAGVVEQLAFGTRGTSSTAKVHIMRYWPENGVPADTPLGDLAPHQIRTIGLYPLGTIGWGLCGIRISIDGRRGDHVVEFDDERLCWKCRDVLDDGNEQRVLMAYRHPSPEV